MKAGSTGNLSGLDREILSNVLTDLWRGAVGLISWLEKGCPVTSIAQPSFVAAGVDNVGGFAGTSGWTASLCLENSDSQIEVTQVKVWYHQSMYLSFRGFHHLSAGKHPALVTWKPSQVCVRDRRHISSPRLQIGATTFGTKVDRCSVRCVKSLLGHSTLTTVKTPWAGLYTWRNPNMLVWVDAEADQPSGDPQVIVVLRWVAFGGSKSKLMNKNRNLEYGQQCYMALPDRIFGTKPFFPIPKFLASLKYGITILWLKLFWWLQILLRTFLFSPRCGSIFSPRRQGWWPTPR